MTVATLIRWNEGLECRSYLAGARGFRACHKRPMCTGVRSTRAKEDDMRALGRTQVTYHDVSAQRRWVCPSHVVVVSDRARPMVFRGRLKEARRLSDRVRYMVRDGRRSWQIELNAPEDVIPNLQPHRDSQWRNSEASIVKRTERMHP